MKLVVLGANGRTGRHVIELALKQGASVTAVVRSDATRLDIQHDELETCVGDPCDTGFLADVFQGQDVVISTLGGRLPTKKATAIYYQSAEAIVEAAYKVGVSRVIVTSSALLFPQTRLQDKLLKALVGNVVSSATRMEETLSAANIDTLAVRCGFLSDTAETRYRSLANALPERGTSISRRSLAQFLLDKATSAWTGHQVFGVSAPMV